MKRKIVVFGGAGFVGSNIACKFAQNNDEVIVVDGLLERTGGSRRNIKNINCTLILHAVEAYDSLSDLLTDADVVVDAMAWTSHLDAIKDPIYDLQLNVISHIHLIRSIPQEFKGTIIYLGSRGQYGRESGTVITEETRMLPDDVQGIDKVAADSYYRVYSRINKLNVISLRFPNCFGPNQKINGDIGLIGGFIKEALAEQQISIFGTNRNRNIVFAPDVANVVFKLSQLSLNGYHAFNMAGMRLSIEQIVKQVIHAAKRGSYETCEIPEHIRNIDMGDIPVNDQKLNTLLGGIDYTEINEAFNKTVAFFREALTNDLEM